MTASIFLIAFPAAPAHALVPAASTASTAVAVVARPVAQDPQIVMQRREEMAEAERRKFVSRSVHPGMSA